MGIARYLSDELCALYREANLRFPQVEVGIVPMVADQMLRGGADTLTDSLTLDFSPAQVASIREGMNRAHNARRIPALSPGAIAAFPPGATPGPEESFEGIRVVSDERIRAVWRNIVLYTMDAIVDCVRAVSPSTPLPDGESAESYRQLTTALPTAFARAPTLLQQVAGMFATTARALESPEARRLAREFRDTLDFKDIQGGRKALLRSRQVLHDALAELLLHSLREEHARFAPLIQSKRWRIFRPLISG
ncbi:hypothetical protein [Corallococcus carmarthensis]|uniref:hypothetical protein n=1 Tax=Corallococcus carmarthensis TaxID=2316728 RepID=UPI00148C8355|nr:hypothetical protein [Corallococcus carmarthensis]NOK18527.1 hypothetical protein [Corallococcus carmarthensis]